MTSIVTVEAHTAKPGGVVMVRVFNPPAHDDQTYVIENGAKHTFHIHDGASLNIMEDDTIVIHGGSHTPVARPTNVLR